jgi:hypothetical protein
VKNDEIERRESITCEIEKRELKGCEIKRRLPMETEEKEN